MKRFLSAIVALLMVLTVTPVSIAQGGAKPRAGVRDVEYRYVETDSFAAGNEYVVAAAVDESSVYALKRGESAIASELLAVEPASGSDAAYITTEDASVVWTYTEEGYLLNNDKYFYPIGTSMQLYTQGRVITYANGHLSYTPSSTPYYVTFANGSFGGNTNEENAAQFRLFVKTEYTPAEPVGKAFVISNGSYALTANASDAFYTSQGYSSTQEYHYYGNEAAAYTAGDAVTDDMLWTVEESGSGYLIKSLDGRYLNATYLSNSTGASDGVLKADEVQDVWTYASGRLQSANSTKYLSYNSNANIFTVRSASSASTIYFYEYDNGEYVGQSDYPVPTPTPSPTPEPTPVPDPTVYHEVAGFIDGADYVIGAVNGEDSVWAIAINGTAVTSQELVVYPANGDDPACVKVYNDTAVWNRTGDLLKSAENTSRYLYPGSGGMNTATSGRTVNYEGGHLTFTASGGTLYYVTCNNGSFGTSTNIDSAAEFRLFTTSNEEYVEPTPTPVPDPTPIAVAQPVNGRTYVISGGGYALTANDTDVTIINNSGAYNYTGLDGITYEPGQTVGAEALWTIWTMGDGYLIKSMDGRVLNGVYGANNSGGYDGCLKLDETWDIWVISGSNYKSSNASEGQSSAKYLAHGGSSANVWTVRSSSSATAITLYEYTAEGEYTDPGTEPYPTIEPTATPVPTATPAPTPVPDPDLYYEVSAFIPNGDFVLGAVKDENTIWACKANGTSAETQEMTVIPANGDTAAYVEIYDGAAVWTITSEGYIQQGSNNFYPSSSGVKITTYTRAVSFADGHLFVTTSDGSTYYVTCDENGALNTSVDIANAATFRLFSTSEPLPEPTPTPVPEPEEFHDTVGFVDGAQYIFGVDNGNGGITAVGYNGDIVAVDAEVLVNSEQGYAYILNSDPTIVWTRTNDGLAMEGRYFYPTSGGSVTTYTGVRVIDYLDGIMSFTSSDGTSYYITFADGAFGTSVNFADAAHIYLFTTSDAEVTLPTPTAVPTPTPEPVPTPIAVTEPVNGHTYVIVVGGYALTSNSTDVTYSNSGGGTQQYIYYGHTGVAYTDRMQVPAEALWTVWTMGDGYLIKSGDGRLLNATYTSNDSGGYTGVLKLDEVWDIWTISGSNYKSSNASATASSDKFLAYCGTSADLISVRSASSASAVVLYEYTADGEYTDPGTEPYPTIEPTATPAPTATPEPTPAPTPAPEYNYVETAELEADKEYIIAAGEGQNVFAIAYNGSAIAPVEYVVEDGMIVTSDTSAVWTRTSEGGLLQGARYLYPTSSGSVTTYTSARVIAYENGLLSFTSSGGTVYYLTYSGGAFVTVTNVEEATAFRVFVKTEGEEPTPTPQATEPPAPVLIGDVNLDGEVSFADVSALYSMLISGNEPTPEQLLAADVDQDGEITFVDVSKLYNNVIS